MSLSDTIERLSRHEISSISRLRSQLRFLKSMDPVFPRKCESAIGEVISTTWLTRLRDVDEELFVVIITGSPFARKTNIVCNQFY